MDVYLLKDVENVGMAGSIAKVADGFAQNFLIPRKLAIKVTDKNRDFYQERINQKNKTQKVIGSKAAMLAEHIKNLHLTIKEKVHDDNKLYGSVGADEIVKLLQSKDIKINKKQVEFPKAIKSLGEHRVIIKLSSKLKPELNLKVVSENK